MGFYDAFNDALRMAQKADNVDLYRQLLELCAQALDLQEENARLRNENAELSKAKDLEERILRHSDLYITLNEDPAQLYYCAHCWDVDKRLVQLSCDNRDGTFYCPHCSTTGIFNNEIFQSTQDEALGDSPYCL